MRLNTSILRLVPLAVLLLMQLSLMATAVAPPVKEFEKNYSESFPLKADGKVRLDNRYGEIKVATWARNEVSIKVRVWVSADNQEKADETFDRIQIDFSGGSNSASAITTIIPKVSKSGDNWFRRIINVQINEGYNSSDYKIYYEVKMPATAQLTTNAKYCDVRLPDLSGATDLSIRYGDLYAGDLTGARNNVEVSYGSARIGELGGRAEFRTRYSDGTIGDGGDIRYDGRYSDFRIGKVNSLDLDIGYEELEIESARKVNMDGNYCDIELEYVETLVIDGNYNDWSVEKLTGSLNLDASYGDFEIDQVEPGFTRIDIDTRYIDVELGIPANVGYTLDASLRYGDISYGDRQLSDRDRVRSGSSETIRGRMIGDGNGQINISSSYGDIELD